MLRPGELLSLQWKDVDLKQRALTVRAEKTKTRRGRVLPISSRLLSILQLRRIDPAGAEFGPDADVFGDEIGRPLNRFARRAENARAAAGLDDFHLADLRHEAASRFEEAGVPTTYVSKVLGHGNLTTTTRYLNATIRGLRLAVEKLEQARQQTPLKRKPHPRRQPRAGQPDQASLAAESAASSLIAGRLVCRPRVQARSFQRSAGPSAKTFSR